LDEGGVEEGAIDAGKAFGGKLLAELRNLTCRPILIGTWAAATWAIRFYEKHGFRMVTPEEKALVDPRAVDRDFGGVGRREASCSLAFWKR
jgi:hypothetical protein